MRKVSGNQNGHQSHGAGNGKSNKTKATIMSELKTWGASIRKLAPMEVFKFRDHLLRLDKDSRRLRFAHGVADSFIEKYASGMNDDSATSRATRFAPPLSCASSAGTRNGAIRPRPRSRSSATSRRRASAAS